MYFFRQSIALCCVLWTGQAFAIGDSGGSNCSLSLDNDPLLRATLVGTPADIQREIESRLDSLEKNTEIKAKIKSTLNPESRERWRSIERAKLINSRLFCGSGEWLLDFAVAAGNVPVTKWLLDHGSNPSATSTYGNIFTRCIDYPQLALNSHYGRKADLLKARLEALDLVLGRGGNSSEVFGEKTALHLCKKPELISHYISRGAELSPPDRQGLKYTPLQESIYDWLGGKALGKERTVIFAAAGADSVRGLKIEKILRQECAKPDRADICSEISRLVKSSPGTFPSIKYRTKLNALDRSEFATVREICEFPEITFVSDYTAFAIVPTRVWLLPKTGIQLDQSGAEAVQMNVVVNSPNVPIFLIADYDSGPIIWNFSVTKGTQILGIALSGYSKNSSVVAGLDDPIPTSRQCGSPSKNQNGPPEMYGLSSDDRLNPFKQKFDKIYYAPDATAYIGDPLKDGQQLLRSSIKTPDSFRGSGGSLAGHMALKDAVLRGALRQATKADVLAWEEGTKKILPIVNDAYVILGAYEYPNGLFGSHSARFVIPKGVPPPRGNPGHSTIYDMNTFKCTGPACN